MQHEQKSAFVLNEDVVRQANPDFIISQNTCEVCAAHTTHVGNVIHILNEKPKLHEMNLGGINFYAGKILPFWKILKDLAHHLSL